MVSIKKKRVSKKTKQSWRKHVDVKDVEEYLEEKRADERLGESFEKKSDQELFQIDTKPLDAAQLSSKEKRRQRLDAPPRCFSMLQPFTKVPDPIVKRNRVRTKEERRDRIAKQIDESRQLRGIVKAKDRLAEQNRALHKARKEANTFTFGNFKKDLWQVEDLKEEDASLKNEWYTNDTIRHTYHGLSKSRKRIPESLQKKRSVLPSVEAPHPGTSYNPSFKDHQTLLNEIVEKEMKIIKEEKHIERVTTKMFKRIPAEKREQNWLVEMSEGLATNSTQNEDKTNANDNGDLKSVNPPTKNMKKDRKQRRKQQEQRDLLRSRQVARVEKKKIADIYKLKKFNEEIKNREGKIQKMQEKRQKVKQYKLLEPKRLSAKKFESADVEFNMGADIAGNLRNMKKEGSILLDRFKSLQKRNILEPTVKQAPRKRAKVKKFEKATHKMGWE
ncbi:uncharacterized protein CBL_07645 [Carabus blaptoides fortunei]